jgi:hypothetical protein
VIEVSGDGRQAGRGNPSEVHVGRHRRGARHVCSSRSQELEIPERVRPEITRNDDGTMTDIEGRIGGALTPARTRARGTRQLKLTTHDIAGAVTDTCDSGSISRRAKR